MLKYLHELELTGIPVLRRCIMGQWRDKGVMGIGIGMGIGMGMGMGMGMGRRYGLHLKLADNGAFDSI
jgi:hypothetical protein